MTKKTIKKILNAKLNHWVKSIEDDKVRNMVKKNAIVTGGAIASMLLKEDVKDFDVYFKDKETTLAVAEYYVSEFKKKHGNGKEISVVDGDDPNRLQGKSVMLENIEPGRVKIIVRSSGVATDPEHQQILSEPFEDVFDVLDKADEVSGETLEKTEEKKYAPVFLSSNAITLSGKIQVVIRFYGEPDKIHENYDFTHCTNYYDLGKDELVLKPEALECLLSKELRYQGSKYPLCSIIRTRKFIQRGFKINAGQYLKMCFQLSQLDLTDINVLEDQLVGVDSAYFMFLIDALRTKQASDPSFVINDGYIATLIDRIF